MFIFGETTNFICHTCRSRFRQKLRLLRPLTFNPALRRSATSRISAEINDTTRLNVSPARKKDLRDGAIFYPLGKIRGTPGKSVREKSVNLETHSLGRPSEVIILHDVADNTQNKLPERMLTEAKSHRILDSKEIVASIEAEKTQLGLEDAVKEIDRLRPDANLTLQAFEDMRHKLRDGYTISQLRNYVAIKNSDISKRKVLSESMSEIGNHFKNEKGVRSLWLADIRPIEERLPLKDTEKARLLTYKRSSKTKLADLVILGCWKVEIEDDVEALGQIEIQLRPWQINLLLSGDPSVLDQIRDKRNVRIDVWRLSVIRVSGYKRSAEETLNDIDGNLLSIDEIEFDTSPFKAIHHGLNKNLFSEEQTGAIARLTQSVIFQVAEKNKVYIRALQRYGAENAHRFLLCLLRLPSFTQTSVHIDEEALNKGMVQTSSDLFLGNKLFRAADSQYSRWVLPQPRMKSPNNEVDVLQAPISLLSTRTLTSDDPLGELLSGRDIFKSSEEARHTSNSTWEDYPGTEVSAVIGHLLHGVRDRHAYHKHSSRALLQKPDTDRTFVNAVSKVNSFLSSNTLEEVKREQAKLICLLVPSPWTTAGVDALKIYPRIALCFGGDAKGNYFELLDMFAINDEFRADVMLPKYGFDVRFLRRRIMKNSKHGLMDPQVNSYATYIKSLALSGAQIQAPLQVDIRVPKRHGFQETLGATHEPAEDKTVPYRLSAIEHRQRTSALVGRVKLSYTVVEAGQVQGSYGEFKLEMPSNAENISATKFVDESLQIIHSIQRADRNIGQER